MIAEKYLNQLQRESPDFTRLYAEMQAQQGLDKTLHIAVCGLMNAGKSALLNALTGHLQEEFFETKAVRATKVVQALTHQGITYVDTPGIDVNNEDEEQAWRGLANADIILFAHNLRTGTLEAAEVEFLKALKRRRPDIESCMLVVLTHSESATDQREARLEAIAGILAPLFQTPRILVPTSFSSYRKGVLEQKPALINHSGINDLHKHLKTWIERHPVDIGAVRRARYQQRKIELVAIVDAVVAKRERELATIESKQSQAFKILRGSIQQLAETVRGRIVRCESSDTN
ncbi:50S ribosome-binding GTPase [Pseudomonas sp. LM20]|uniref:GTPase n=1 Tax=Pseudomonas sp. LM20 TaxID=2899116 RepID=UPI001F388B41|nr:GTPase [Pseudomonas sp. LM20]MCE5989551.1 50S ribosome-binding GTPase [Pseudomonas sp. LM20]